ENSRTWLVRLSIFNIQLALFSASDRFLTSPGDSLIIFLCGMDNFADGQETNLVKIHQKEQGTFIKGGASLWTS
ncbi:hypothetical protein, partial [uncultured Oscillibacter sp.]|uniref:hypothetical protein n=1 Tax=uncultured Oscillibacter sp. TaxID=876091 RepID=UPI002611ECD7